jgi:hypothetical protein
MNRTVRAVALAMATLIVGWPVPLPVTSAAYSAACTGPGNQISQTAVVRGQDLGFVGTDFRGAIGDAVVRNIVPCSGPTATKWDIAAVLPANLQSSTVTNAIVQIGWMRCIKPAGSTCPTNIPADGNMHFVYICDDNSGGSPCLADGWAGTPVSGRRYRFRVQYNQTGTADWDYSIQDLVTGTVKKTKINSSWHNADGAWWGAETHQTGSTMGPANTSGNTIRMYWMQYLRASVSGWQVVTDISTADEDIIEAGVQPSRYSYGIFSQNYTLDGVNIYTVDH